MTDQTRISVALTPEDHREVLKLARRCNTSVSALGQLAVRHMLLRERDGTVPMLPAEPVSTERHHSEQLVERAAEGIAFWRSEADSPSLPDMPGLFGDADFGRARVFLTPEPTPEPPSKIRVSVGLLEDEAARINALAQRCSTSASALGELAYKHLLLQAANGAIPLLPPADDSGEPESNMALARKGRMHNVTVWKDEAIEHIQFCEARINELDVQDELDRLAKLTGPDHSTYPGAG